MCAVVQSLIDLRQIQGLFNEGIVDILYEFKDNWTSILHPRQWRFQKEMPPARNCTFRLQSTWQFRPSTPYRKKYPWDNWRVQSDKERNRTTVTIPRPNSGDPANHELRRRFSSKGARPWLDQCTLQELQKLPLKPDHLQRNKATNLGSPQVTLQCSANH